MDEIGSNCSTFAGEPIIRLEQIIKLFRFLGVPPFPGAARIDWLSMDPPYANTSVEPEALPLWFPPHSYDPAL